jgi:preprotein translocase subunit SecE
LGVQIPPGLPLFFKREDRQVFNKIKIFLREVKIELKKVVFPGREEVIGSTKVVLVLVFITAFFLGVIDMLLSKIIEFVIK